MPAHLYRPDTQRQLISLPVSAATVGPAEADADGEAGVAAGAGAEDALEGAAEGAAGPR
jgi:hypothetical protein